MGRSEPRLLVERELDPGIASDRALGGSRRSVTVNMSPRAGKLVLAFALDRVADFYRVR